MLGTTKIITGMQGEVGAGSMLGGRLFSQNAKRGIRFGKNSEKCNMYSINRFTNNYINSWNNN